MRNTDPSPSAAELYFDRSPFGQLYILIADALQRKGSNQRHRAPSRSTKRPDEEGIPSRNLGEAPRKPRLNLLERLEAWQWRQSQKDREAYLSQSRDVFDLERDDLAALLLRERDANARRRRDESVGDGRSEHGRRPAVGNLD